MLRFLCLLLLIVVLGACRPTVYTPKPPGYFRLDTPLSHQYRLFDREGYPYTFEYPVYAEIYKDTVYQNGKPDNPYWINILYPSLGGEINVTYKSIPSRDMFQQMLQDAHGFTFFHHQKADYINEESFTNPKNGIALNLYTVGGNAASRYQFMATDSVKNFMIGSLYFDVTPNADSLKPATDFIQADIQHMLLTLKFR